MTKTEAKSGPDPLGTWRPFRGPFARWPRLADTLLALLALMLTVSMSSSRGDGADLPTAAEVLAAAAFLIGNLALIWRRRHPFRVHAIVVLASLVAVSAPLYGQPVFALSISLYSLGRYEGIRQRSFLGVAAGIALLALDRLVLAVPDSSDPGTFLMAFLVWYIGRQIRFRGEYLRLLKERAEQLEREQHAGAEKAVAEERTRIARELHDIVAHQVSLMTVQAGAAKVVADKNPAAAQEAMGLVERAGRTALDELRHLMGVLRPDADSLARVPQPGIRYLQRLLDDFRKAGLTASLDIDADLPALPVRVDLSLYRIVQEALTNVLKHAGPGANTTVSIYREAKSIRVEIEN
ncbi:MAG: histidine kinase, partial [Pseudomonadota bacterium]